MGGGVVKTRDRVDGLRPVWGPCAFSAPHPSPQQAPGALGGQPWLYEALPWVPSLPWQPGVLTWVWAEGETHAFLSSLDR